MSGMLAADWWRFPRLGRLLSSTVISALLTVQRAGAEPPEISRLFQKDKAVLLALDSQWNADIELLFAELEQGVRKEKWLNEDRVRIETPIRSLLAQTRPGEGVRRIRAMMDAVSPSSSSEIIQIRQWLAQRSDAVMATRGAITEGIVEDALSAVDEAWSRAEGAADLKDAVDLLIEIGARLGEDWTKPIFNPAFRQPSVRTVLAQRGVANLRKPLPPLGLKEAYDVLTVIGSTRPLLLPDPGRDPAGFIAARGEWILLRNNHHPFVHRPAPAARFAELECKAEILIHEAEIALRRALLENVLPEELHTLYSKCAAFRSVHPVTLRPGRLVPFPDREDFRRSLILPPQVAMRNSVLPLVSDDRLLFYRAWIAVREGEEAKDPAKIREAAEQLKANSVALLSDLPPQILAELRSISLAGAR